MDEEVAKENIFSRVNEIIEVAHKNIVTTVNINMVVAYWLIGREIVLEVQGGEKRASYGKQVIENLSKKLNDKYKNGFSASNLNRFRKFYLIYSDRISSPLGTELQLVSKTLNSSPMGTEFNSKNNDVSFSPQLTWSHYRAIMRVKDEKARVFYESV